MLPAWMAGCLEVSQGEQSPFMAPPSVSPPASGQADGQRKSRAQPQGCSPAWRRIPPGSEGPESRPARAEPPATLSCERPGPWGGRLPAASL